MMVCFGSERIRNDGVFWFRKDTAVCCSKRVMLCVVIQKE